MHCHCGTNNRAPLWTFTNHCKPEVRPGVQEESASPAWLAASAINARDTTIVYIHVHGGLTLDVDYIESVTATTHQEKGIITLESNPSRGTVLPALQGKGNKCDKNVKYKKNWCTVTEVLSGLFQEYDSQIQGYRLRIYFQSIKRYRF